jgi:hypothetical protein
MLMFESRKMAISFESGGVPKGTEGRTQARGRGRDWQCVYNISGTEGKGRRERKLDESGVYHVFSASGLRYNDPGLA